jgi:hypothetical protein
MSLTALIDRMTDCWTQINQWYVTSVIFNCSRCVDHGNSQCDSHIALENLTVLQINRLGKHKPLWIIFCVDFLSVFFLSWPSIVNFLGFPLLVRLIIFRILQRYKYQQNSFASLSFRSTSKQIQTSFNLNICFEEVDSMPHHLKISCFLHFVLFISAVLCDKRVRSCKLRQHKVVFNNRNLSSVLQRRPWWMHSFPQMLKRHCFQRW